jgi:hypothetical protein
MLVWAGIPILITLVFFCLLGLYWEAKVKPPNESIKYKTDTFTAPINSALSVTSLIMPLLCGAIGYLASQLVAPIELIPLLAIAGLLGLSIIVGLWNMFSLTASQNGEITITTKSLTWFVPQVVAQVCLLFSSVVVLLIYVFFFFDLPKPVASSNSRVASLIARPPISVGTQEGAITKAWGLPASVQSTDHGTEWHYPSSNSEFILSIDKGIVVSVTERKIP